MKSTPLRLALPGVSAAISQTLSLFSIFDSDANSDSTTGPQGGNLCSLATC